MIRLNLDVLAWCLPIGAGAHRATTVTRGVDVRYQYKVILATGTNKKQSVVEALPVLI